MKFRRSRSSYLLHPRRRRYYWRLPLLIAVLFVTFYAYSRLDSGDLPLTLPQVTVMPKAGDVMGTDSIQTFTPEQATSMIRANYGAATQPATYPITKVTFRYRSQLPSGEFITVYGRAYLPATTQTNLPIFAFATGTTGIGDRCAPSLEQPAVANWANYDSHMAKYASQGFAAVVTDYEGMRDTARIHHYMVGELEGRAVLDSVRGLQNLTEAKGRLNSSAVFLAGYSQGGHAAFWADKIASRYAPEIKPMGVLGFGPVMSVKQTLTDITRGANINWFGPYVLFSYGDYYKQAYGSVLLPRWQDNLARDVQSQCIDTDIPYWGSIPGNVYQPEFLKAIQENKLGDLYPALDADMERNNAYGAATNSAKRINQGAHDNVVLPVQQETVAPDICRTSKGVFQYVPYPHANHYNTMAQSFNDTVSWMRALLNKIPITSTCP